MIDIPMNVKQPMSLSEMGNEQFQGKSQVQNIGQPQGQPQGQLQGFGAQGQGFNQAQPQGFNQTQPQGFGAQPQNFGAQPQGQAQGFGYTQAQPVQPVQQNFNNPPQSQAQPQAQVRQHPSNGGGVILKKGQKTSLSKLNPNLDLIDVGLGWDLGPNGQAYDLDVEAFLLNQQDKVIGDDWFVFYNQPASPDGSVRLLGDNTTGAGAGDDEIIQVRLSQVNANVAKLLFIVTINEAKERGYNFSNVQNAYVRIVDKSTNKELVRFNLTDYYNTVCSMMVGEVYRHNGEWKFSPIGDGTQDDLEGLCRRYGVNIAG